MTESTEPRNPLEPPTAGGEWETLHGFLAYFRDAISYKTEGLTDDELRLALSPSTMTLGGMLKHLTLVEREWFAYFLSGIPHGEPWESADWENEPDWDWQSADQDSGDELRAAWARAVDESNEFARIAHERGGMEARAEHEPHGSELSLRWIMVHMIEEYARHCGHADLIREAIDGQVGDRGDELE